MIVVAMNPALKIRCREVEGVIIGDMVAKWLVWRLEMRTNVVVVLEPREEDRSRLTGETSWIPSRCNELRNNC